MRTIVDLPERHVEALDRLAAQRRESRTALVREAVDVYLEGQAVAGRQAAFGGWDGDEDGLAVQRRLCGEWDDR
ncbi:MAG: ribbon-helix-helix protein, CopG family [Trueperaceae bacterium]|nr:ribbon-helix-helix protein, CopG family [Trueperaceae bacterium]